MISNLYIDASPRELLEGECKASPSGLNLKYARDEVYNIYSLDVAYTCTLKTRNRQAQAIDVMKFETDIKFYIKAEAGKISLNFNIDRV